MSSEIRVGDIGTVLILTILDQDEDVVDVSSGSPLEIIILDNSGNRHVRTAGLYTDGTDGKISYTLVDGDIVAVGSVEIQARVTIGAGTWYSNVARVSASRRI